jgi:GNAT superfamily N-acetyltransferase
VTKTVEIRPLTKEDDRSAFSCGQPDLDRFFEHYAGQNQFKLHLAVTYVAVAEAKIVGFATVAAGAIERGTLPKPRLRGRLPAYPLPVLRLARLGVDARAQGLGIGKALLRHVLRLAVDQRDRLGCIGVVTDAKPDAMGFYESLGFVPLVGVREGSLHSDPTPMFLAIGSINAALRDCAGHVLESVPPGSAPQLYVAHRLSWSDSDVSFIEI